MCVLNKLLIQVCVLEGVINNLPHYVKNELGYLFFTLVVNNKMMVICCYHGVQMHQLHHLLLNICLANALTFFFTTNFCVKSHSFSIYKSTITPSIDYSIF